METVLLWLLDKALADVTGSGALDGATKISVAFALPPIKPVPHIDSTELDTIVKRVSDPAEQDRLAKEFVQQMKDNDSI